MVTCVPRKRILNFYRYKAYFNQERSYNRFTIGSPITLKMLKISIKIRLLEDITTVL